MYLLDLNVLRGIKITYVFVFIGIAAIVFAASSVYDIKEISILRVYEPLDSISDPLPFPIPQESSTPSETFANQNRPLRLQPSPELRYEIVYNEETDEYIAQQMLGNTPIGPPYAMTPREYFDFSAQQRRDQYWRNRAAATRSGDESEFRPSLNFGTESEDGFFSDNLVDITPQGAAELTFGFRHTNNRNPRFTKRQQRTTQPHFDTKIQMSVTGNIGDKMSLVVKYDTEAQFEFEREIKLEYEGDEDEIIKKIEFGNVSFPLNSSLITGSQSLFGIKTDLQFGKLFVSGVFSRQQGDFQSISVQGGAQSQEFLVRADNYERNRHYFLSHYFREKYEDAFANAPEIASGIIIRKVQVWVTQASLGREDSRNILAMTDLGDSYENTIQGKEYNLPQNGTLYQELRNTQGIRNINNITTLLQNKYVQGRDYERVEQAILLRDNEFEVNTKLGYISLRTAVHPSRILGVAFEYEYKGEIYQVGEFSNDGVDHPEVLIVKMLKSPQANPSYNNWDLMMKNVYSIGGFQISRDEFVLDVLYEDDRTGTPVPYISEGDIARQNLLSVFNLDNITTDNMPYPDGLFDFIEGYTINSARGLIYFPVLEPFGSYLEEKIGDAAIAQKYVFKELYDSTQSAARQVSERNKFILKGKYQSDVRSEIFLNATQVQEGSVSVSAGGRVLTEGVDYTVDYMGGSVKIINEGLLQSGANIVVNFESNPLFNMKTKTLMGTRLDYRYSRNINFGATLLRLSEQPMVHKVGFDDYPIHNTIWGLDATYSTRSTGLTAFVDRYVPFVSVKDESTIQLAGEFAQLIPGQSKYISDAVELDNFENTENRIYLREPTSWKMASTPQGQPALFPEGSAFNDLSFRFNAALISWYDINRTFYGNNSDVSTTVQRHPYSRPIYEKDLFPNKDVEVYNRLPMSILNIAYYPSSRGQYNYDARGLPGVSAGLHPDGTLKNPRSRWGGLMVPLTTTDFEETNVEYIEFWLMDPFITDTLNVHKGGDFYINLGRISEDVLRDGRKAAEHGLTNEPERFDETVWGRVPNYQLVETGFSNTIAREIQDVGLDGLSDEQERVFFASYLNEVQQIVNDDVFQQFYSDPSADNFYSYRDNRGVEKDIVWRYRYFSRVDGNSPSGTSEGTATFRPDMEDINNDNTLQETEAYYQYRISLRQQDMVVGKNFIVDNVTELVDGKPDATWYQFKIPINTDQKQRIGDISDFRDIPFMRMFLRDFEDSVVLRIAKFSLVYSSWRRFNQALFEPGEYDIFNDSEFDVSVVNIEQNSNRVPVSYVLPPGVERVMDPMHTTLRKLNESALALQVTDLDDGNSKAVYKMFNRDLRQFGKIEMFIHAEALIGQDHLLDDGDLVAFIRIGSDFTENYYEYEIPLTLTPHRLEGENRHSNNSIEDRFLVWPKENMLSLDLSVLTELKLERDRMILEGIIPDLMMYHIFTVPHGNNKVRIKGRPSISNVRTIMLGVRNPKRSSSNLQDDGLSKSGIVWFNELRVTDINDQGGWAAIGSARIGVADFATLSLAAKTSRPGFGSIDQKVFERSQEYLFQYDVASNVSLHKFFPESWGLQIPFYVDFSEIFITPQYDPTNPDVLLRESLNNMTDSYHRDSLLSITQDYTRRSSYNFTNVRIVRQNSKPSPFNVGNFSTSYAYSQQYSHNIDYVKLYDHRYRVGFNYTYNMRPKSYEPFKSNKIGLIKDINFSLLPTSVTIRNDWDRMYKEQQRRNLSSYVELPLIASKRFDWIRTYSVRYNLAKNVLLTYDAVNTARIHEPPGVIDKTEEEIWEEYKQEVWRNLTRFGENVQFSQKVGLTYKIPIDKIKMFDWITSNYRYTGTYDWQQGAQLASGLDFGNTIKNSNTKTIDANLNLTRVYQKSEYLKGVERRMRRTGTPQQQRRETVKFEEENVTLQQGQVYVINHRLRAEDVRITIIDANGQLVQGQTNHVSDSRTEFTPVRSAEGVRIVAVGRREIVESTLTKITDNTLNLLMMTKTISINYTISEGTYIPGYKYTTEYFGIYQPFGGIQTPGWGYVLGMIPNDLEDNLNTQNWIVDNDLISEKFKQTYSNQLRLQASLQPIRNMRITLNSDRRFSENYDRYLIGDYETTKNNAQISGNYSLTYNTISTSFNADKAYEDFKQNRVTIAHRLAKQEFGDVYEVNPDNNFPRYYDETSQDVLLPAFVSAYSGQKAEDVYLDDYFKPMFASVSDFLRTLNWRFSYNGLSRLEPFKKYFRSLNINHAYTSTYNIGAYQTFTAAETFEDFYRNPSNGELYMMPQYDVRNVSITERFNPIIGFDARMQNNVTGRFEVRNNRTVTLSFTNTEISENGGLEYVIGGGYVFEKFKLRLNNQTYENDLTVRMDFSVRDNKTVRRNIVEDVSRVISGTRMYSLKTYGDYMLNERFTFRIFLDYNMNSPYTNGYKTSSWNGGVNLRFSLI